MARILRISTSFTLYIFTVGCVETVNDGGLP